MADDETPKPLISEKDWDAEMAKLTCAMTAHLQQYRTPIFIDHGDHGKGWGSGSFIGLSGKKYILTNEHVAKVMTDSVRLGFKLNDQEELSLVAGGAQIHKKWPWDLALLPVSDQAWSSVFHRSSAIQTEQIGLAHTPVPNEIFAFVGYAGEATSFHFGQMQFRATTSLSREGTLETCDFIDDRFHFGLVYSPDRAATVAGHHGLPAPPGLSGSTVWNTCFVEARTHNIEWSPELAKVAGVVWGWPSDQGLIVATRAEHVRSFLLGAAEELDRASHTT